MCTPIICIVLTVHVVYTYYMHCFDSLCCVHLLYALFWQSMFDATLKDRKNSFHAAPGTSMFIHWLVGMVYVFYFASFILLLREVLRPGVLWFLRNLNDPEFNPIQEVCTGSSVSWNLCQKKILVINCFSAIVAFSQSPRKAQKLIKVFILIKLAIMLIFLGTVAICNFG